MLIEIEDDDEVHPSHERAQVHQALQGQRGTPSVHPMHCDETYSMCHHLGRKPYEVPTKVLGVPSAIEEWGAHCHLGPVRCL